MTRNISTTVATTAFPTMNLTTESQHTCVDYDALQIPLAVLYSVIFVLGLAGNLVALWVFFCVHSKKNSVRVFLINVAFADLLLVVCLPFRILYHSQGNIWNLDPTLCKVVGNAFYMNMYISVTLLGLISIDRYMKLHRSAGMQHRLRSTRWSAALCAFVWTAAFTLTLVLMMSKNHSHSDRLVTAVITLHIRVLNLLNTTSCHIFAHCGLIFWKQDNHDYKKDVSCEINHQIRKK